jgi:hypothetical protein
MWEGRTYGSVIPIHLPAMRSGSFPNAHCRWRWSLRTAPYQPSWMRARLRCGHHGGVRLQVTYNLTRPRSVGRIVFAGLQICAWSWLDRDIRVECLADDEVAVEVALRTPMGRPDSKPAAASCERNRLIQLRIGHVEDSNSARRTTVALQA